MRKNLNPMNRNFVIRTLVTALVMVMLSVTALAVDVSTWAEIVDAVTNGGTNVELKLLKDITAEGVVDVQHTVTVNFNGYKITNAPGCDSAFNRYMSGSLYYDIGTEADLTMSLVDPSVSTIRLTKDIQITNSMDISDLSKVEMGSYTITPASSDVDLTIHVDNESELRKALATGATSIVLDANINLSSELVVENTDMIEPNGHSIGGQNIVIEVDTYQELTDALNDGLADEVRMMSNIHVGYQSSYTIDNLSKLNPNNYKLQYDSGWQKITANVSTEAELRKALDMSLSEIVMQNDIALSAPLETDNFGAIKTNDHKLSGDIVVLVDTYKELDAAMDNPEVDQIKLTGPISMEGDLTIDGFDKLDLNGYGFEGGWGNLKVNVYDEEDLKTALSIERNSTITLQKTIVLTGPIVSSLMGM